jgi:predicted secreted protein
VIHHLGRQKRDLAPNAIVGHLRRCADFSPSRRRWAILARSNATKVSPAPGKSQVGLTQHPKPSRSSEPRQVPGHRSIRPERDSSFPSAVRKNGCDEKTGSSRNRPTGGQRAWSAHTQGVHRKWSDSPHVFMAFGLKYDGGIIVSAQVIAAKRLNYDGGVIVKFYHDNASHDGAMTYAMTAEYLLHLNALTYLLNLQYITS